MSYHRVLPPPPALANQNRAGSWIIEPEALLQPRKMTNQKTYGGANKNRSPTSSEKSSSPAAERVSPSIESLEKFEDPPKARKRSSSQASDGENFQLQRRLPSISKASTVSLQGESPSQICLCQPDPKVPRPRNAFILYRQHHQATVVQQNPGLANPEISKVIGDHWRSSPPDVKNHWKCLADEEKLRHQKQYPDYRYQPRRSGRNGSISSSNTSASTIDSETRRCVKCGGRSMTTPGIISGPNFSANTPGSLYSPNRPPSTPASGSSAARFLQTVSSPSNPSLASYRSRATTSASSNLSALTLASPHFKRGAETPYPSSPDSKRRRILPPGAHPHSRTPSGPSTPFPFPRRRESLPRPDFMPPPTVTMGPPPRPHPNGPTNHPPDSSLTLPPLQTVARALESPGTTQAKSVEAMVMSISVPNKIRVLAKISPPLASPGPTSPKHATRGFVIAVDGADPKVVSQVTACLCKVLEPSHPVRVFEGPRADKGSEVSFTAYLRTIEAYHALSKDVITFITTVPEKENGKETEKEKQTEEDDREEGEVTPDSINPKSTTKINTAAATKATSTSSHPADTEMKDDHPSTPTPTTSTLPTPIAILPTYQLTHTDTAASRIPIQDAYAPIDHWQWMATLWRGIVGADVTVAVRERSAASAARDEAAKSRDEAGKGRDEVGKGRDEVGRGKGVYLEPEVEIRLEDARALVVRAERGRVGEGGLRRVGFEVGEWVRGREGG